MIIVSRHLQKTSYIHTVQNHVHGAPISHTANLFDCMLLMSLGSSLSILPMTPGALEIRDTATPQDVSKCISEVK